MKVTARGTMEALVGVQGLACFEVRVVDDRVGIDITAAIKAAIDPMDPSVARGHVDGLSALGQPACSRARATYGARSGSAAWGLRPRRR